MIFRSRTILAITLTCLIGWVCSYLTIEIFSDYTMGLFIWLPLVMGVLATVIAGYKREVTRTDLRYVSFVTLAVFCFGLLLFAWEGLICLVMAAPLGILFTWIGYRIGYALIETSIRNAPVAAVLLALSVPALMAFENALNPEEPLRSVTTSIEIDASPEEVWKNVIAFPQLKAPTEFIFKTGIAYPVNATIQGKGVGAVRHCNFSTGSFVEPITVWKEAELLRFSVAAQPVPMKELSPYDIQPKHLHGYWVSKQGQFKLTRLKNGGTRLEGTTWYINKIKPGFYWTLWSDYIVHTIHARVLEHIKMQTELSLH